MSESKLYDVPPDVAAKAYINNDKYNEMYQRSISDPEGFWAEQAEEFIDWIKPWNKVWNWDYDEANIAWFEGAKLNVAYNCLDRHLASRGDQVAVIWEGDDPGADKKITYRQLHEDVCKFANVLKSRGVKKGDRVSIYMPMVSEVVVAILACARIGAVHSIVFGGFSPESLKDRILDSDCQVVITADEGLRGARPVPLKANADKALEACPNVHTVVVVKCTGGDIAWHDERDVWYQEIVAEASSDCPPEEMDAEDPLFILYTSGSTGKPKGVLHTTGGYILYAAMTHKYIF
ncbi:MAG: AMP-binding protein, partial [Gammaproteobacteria bacterium]|nr:AMP-binding protein [Gammaproteobacteria bacterium]